MMNIILSILFGGALVVLAYETYREKREKDIVRLLAPKVERLIEETSMKIAERQKLLNRPLTDAEKNKVCDECYSRL